MKFIDRLKQDQETTPMEFIAYYQARKEYKCYERTGDVPVFIVSLLSSLIKAYKMGRKRRKGF